MAKTWVTALAAGLAVSASAQQYIMACESTADRIVLLDGTTGALVDPAFIDVDAVNPTVSQTIKDVIQVGDQIWVSDQLADRIYRFSLGGGHLGTISGGLDNIRGMGLLGDRVYVTNAGAANGAPGNAVVIFDTTGAQQGSFATFASPFDVEVLHGDLLIGSSQVHAIKRYSTSGTDLGDWLPAGTLRFPQQIHLHSNGNVFVAGFSIQSPTITSGLYRFTSAGAFLPPLLASGTSPRGVTGLGNGNALWLNSQGIWRIDLGTGASTLLLAGSGQYANPVNRIPAPIAFSGRFSLEGYLPTGPARRVTFVAHDPVSGAEVARRTTLLTTDATFNLTLYLAPGTYDLSMKPEHGLRRKISGVNVTTTGVESLVFDCLNGDADRNNAVDIDDFLAMAASYERSQGQSSYNVQCDFDGSTAVNIDDFLILAGTYETFGD